MYCPGWAYGTRPFRMKPMHHLPRVLILTAAVAAGCSDNPTSPTAPTAPPFANSYTVEFVASASCPNGGQGTMFQRTFQFEMVSRANSNTALAVELPSAWNQADPARSAPNSGDLTLNFTYAGGELQGTVGGYGLAANGIHSFGVYESGRQGTARATGRKLADGTLEGTLSGLTTFSVFRTSAGGECTASGHSWRATPR